jgi:NAD(P)-dependent dehydrogenase (short-subunit alcohol dehydrogenase family)
MDKLEGRTAVITGGASGIGLATAKRLASHGVQLVLADIEEPALERAVASLEGLGVKVLAVPCDVASLSQVEAVRDAALETFGSVEIVFNNAGVGASVPTASPMAIWEWVLDVNLKGVIHGVTTFLPLLLEQNEGHIVNTASAAGLGGLPWMLPYCASKFAVVGLTESLYFELAEREGEVHCSVLCPGNVKTEIYHSERNLPKALASWAEQDQIKSMVAQVKQFTSKGMDPSEVAEQVVGAILDERFWILPDQELVVNKMRSRLDWMVDGSPSTASLNLAVGDAHD